MNIENLHVILLVMLLTIISIFSLLIRVECDHSWVNSYSGRLESVKYLDKQTVFCLDNSKTIIYFRVIPNSYPRGIMVYSQKCSKCNTEQILWDLNDIKNIDEKE